MTKQEQLDLLNDCIIGLRNPEIIEVEHLKPYVEVLAIVLRDIVGNGDLVR